MFVRWNALRLSTDALALRLKELDKGVRKLDLSQNLFVFPRAS